VYSDGAFGMEFARTVDAQYVTLAYASQIMQEHRATATGRYGRDSSGHGDHLGRCVALRESAKRSPDPICNTDLKPDNILIRPQEVLPIILDELISEPFEVRIEDPEDYPVGLVRYDSLPLPPTRDASQYNLVDPLEIAIVDFGRGKT
jgi:serine/threonine protein kinase